MDIEIIRDYCLKKKGVTEGFPFGEGTLVFKVMNKLFCLSNLEPPISINLKCKPERVLELREKYEGVIPGYHMNKKHWNTIEINSGIPEKEILSWIDDSYNLVVDKLTQKDKKELDSL
ncbi:MAG: MmcQ/YjbR family DNA-binding protein [Ignavibacteriae bacterium]|nr:MmcQ/YjbR family DNA-binding protein [Ignavibacteriota bacterium]NOG99046.1 MmcQ/YjbR family DNA-binding protein [Ignavibacteriota bacterium]